MRRCTSLGRATLSAVLAAATIVLIGVALGSCGSRQWGPVAGNGAELDALRPDTEWIRARGITDDDVPALARFTRLRTLDLWGGWGSVPQRVTARGFASLARLNLPSLEELLVAHSDQVTNASLAEIANVRCADLYLIACPDFDDRGLALLEANGRLSLLDLRGCAQIGDGTVPVLGTLKSLRTLRLAGTGVTSDGADRLRKLLPGCDVDLDATRFTPGSD